MSLWTMTDEAAGKPKYLSDELRNAQTVSDKDATIGINAAEAADSGSVAKGLTTPGWVNYVTYTDANGNVRHKSEVLVASGSMASDGTETLTDDLGGGGGGGGGGGTSYTGWTSGAMQGVSYGPGEQLALYAYPSNDLDDLWTAVQAATAGTAISFVIGGTTYNSTLASPTTSGGGPQLPIINITAGSGASSGPVTSVTFG